MDDLIKAFTIFRKYTDDEYCIGCEHDEMFVYVDAKLVSDEDKIILEELGFSINDFEGFSYIC